MLISSFIKEERPYEKYQKYGLEALTDKDLLAIVLRTGTKEYSVEALAGQLLNFGGVKKNPHSQKTSLIYLYQLSYEELQQIKGIGKIKALQIIALLELSKRIAKERHQPLGKMNSPQPIADYFMEELRYAKQENFLIVFLDAKCQMTGYQLISTGSLTASIVHPREVYKAAIQHVAHSIVALHNHPSGDPTPSKEDINMTKRLKEGGELIGIPLLDHIIIGDGRYVSLKEESYI